MLLETGGAGRFTALMQVDNDPSTSYNAVPFVVSQHTFVHYFASWMLLLCLGKGYQVEFDGVCICHKPFQYCNGVLQSAWQKSHDLAVAMFNTCVHCNNMAYWNRGRLLWVEDPASKTSILGSNSKISRTVTSDHDSPSICSFAQPSKMTLCLQTDTCAFYNMM